MDVRKSKKRKKRKQGKQADADRNAHKESEPSSMMPSTPLSDQGRADLRSPTAAPDERLDHPLSSPPSVLLSQDSARLHKKPTKKRKVLRDAESKTYGGHRCLKRSYEVELHLAEGLKGREKQATKTDTVEAVQDVTPRLSSREPAEVVKKDEAAIVDAQAVVSTVEDLMGESETGGTAKKTSGIESLPNGIYRKDDVEKSVPPTPHHKGLRVVGIAGTVIVASLLVVLIIEVLRTSKNTIEVHVPGYGTVRGITVSVEERSVFSFCGVRFAEATGGRRRFRPPVPVGQLTDTADATAPKPGCAQKPEVIRRYVTIIQSEPTEDCLHMNIWTPCTAVTNPGCRKTVVVFLFGIGFQVGDNNRYDGRYFSALGDVVLVVPNFRMGAFGFVSLGTSEFPGNLPLRDQQLAVQWIFDHIQHFGGDTNNVVLMGSAAGAWSIGAHFLGTNPYWRQRFSRIILQSESPFRRYYEMNASTIGSHLSCPTSPAEKLIECLQNVPARDIIRLTGDFRLHFGPSFDGDPLPQPPWILARRTDVHKKDVLIGSTSSEACTLVATIMVQVRGSAQPITKAITDFIFDAYRVQDRTSLLRAYAQDNNVSWVYDLVADMVFDCPILSFAQYLASRGNQVRAYLFNHTASNSLFKECFGAPRFQELDFVFGAPIRNASLVTTAEVVLSRKMIEMWTGFAKTGSLPNVQRKPWPYFTVEKQQHVRISTGLLDITGDYKRRTCETMGQVLVELYSWNATYTGSA